METNKIALYGNVIFAALILVATSIFMFTEINNYIIKTLDSALFVLCGIFNIVLLYKFKDASKKWKTLLMLAGLAFAFLGDILLIDYFTVGAILFAIGHVFFLVYFCLLQKINLMDCLIALTIFVLALLLILLYPKFNFNGMKIIAIVYALIISCMLGKAIGNYIKVNSLQNLIIFIGATLFFFSDLMLLFSNFSDISPLFSYFCLATYYPGEFLLAFAIFLHKK